jgi:hypothetical protein
MRSTIFDEYAKIAEAKGLVKIAQETESKELKKYKSDDHPRVGSDDISTIEALYGVKPDSPLKYKHNIMESAHPKAVIIAPSYDKINGLVENNIEQQTISINIVNKPTDGIPNYTKYAQKELLMELVRIANDMDNQGKEDLRKLADECIEELSNEDVKKKP